MSTSSSSRLRAAAAARGAQAVAAWNRWWFEPEPVSTAAVIRIAYGLLVLLWTVSLAPDLLDLFGRGGVVPSQPEFGSMGQPTAWGLLGPFPSDGAVVLVYLLLLAGALCLVVGLGTRIAAAAVFVGLASFTRRDPWVLNSGDGLLRVMSFYVLLLPGGSALSLDRVLRRRDPWEFPLRAPWVVRLLQIQLSVVYLTAVWDKTRGTTWNDGTAVSYALRLGDIQRFALPEALTTSLLVSNLMTFGTLALELSLGVLVWQRRLRPWVLLGGVLLHLGIEAHVRVGFFSWGMLVLYLCFLPPERAREWLLAVRARIARRRARGRPAAAAP